MNGDLSNRNGHPAESTDRVRFVAEVSSNHGRDLDRALRFVERAAEIGCDGVKFQLFRIDELFAPEILRRSQAHRARRAWELPESYLAPLARRCRSLGLEFGCTPFYLQAVDILSPFVDFLKVASYELLWDELLAACAKTRLPLVLSTGMATLEEVRHAVGTIAAHGGRDLTLLQCVSGYPAPAGQANLGAIDTLASLDRDFPELTLRAGWSDHTVEPGVIHRAVHAHPTSMVEFHLDLEGEGEEFEGGHCWLPDRMAETIAQVRVGAIAEGTRHKGPTPIEEQERSWRADPRDGLRPMRPLRRQWSPTA
ncbi:MAG TPA: N-acetylneuraminic acid synthase [Deltaproteobacteria bacterium]|nr:N-acetylneuraminic acid synthase [Deltaproteobacteria bacterium]